MSSLLRWLAPSALLFTALSGATDAAAAYDCSSPNPADWPPPSKPYFMIAFDTSGSMDDSVGSNPSCTGYPDTRIGHARCALSNMLKAYAGEVNFGLATFPRRLTKTGNPAAKCPNSLGNGASNTSGINGCSISNLFSDTCGSTGTGTNAAAANILVPLRQDDYFNTPPTSVSNTAELLSWVDNQCGDCKELFSNGYTPLNGILRDMYRYLSTQWSAPGGTPTYATPLTGTERSCRSVNVILMTDGAETCDPNRNSTNGNAGAVQASAAAAQLLAGWNIGATHWSAFTHVIAIGNDGTVVTDTNNIAAAGGTTAAHQATNEKDLSQALATIIAGSVKPEVCDNADNNCNGCVDEGSVKYCNRNRTGRNIAYLSTAANNPGPGDCCNDVRANCLTRFNQSITAAKPQGDAFWLPCWDPTTDGVSPETKWLCSNPGEACDDKDNNCEKQIDPAKSASFATNVVDENQLKCGSPAHCPVAETCDNTDQNCDGVIDNTTGSGTPYSVCPNNCQPVPELCNGCDDDCDGIADNGVPDLACGFSPPAACLGTKKCTPVAVSGPGACIPGVTRPGKDRYPTTCNASGNSATETCNGIDDNCDGQVDNNPTGQNAACTPTAGAPTIGACKAGHQVCENGAFVCVGYIGPTTEICDGIDNDCDGLVDGADPDLTGLGQACGANVGQCTKGVTACVGGSIVCQGGKQPQPEVCNGFDDDCNGVVDDSPGDTPPVLGCWSSPVSATCTTTCTGGGKTWCPPPGGSCTGLGSLGGACKPGTLICLGKAGWSCAGDVGPQTEVCNGVDDDCDKEVDEDLTKPFGDVCGSDVPPCKSGILKCVDGAPVCVGQTPPQPEVCNGKDDDCDTVVDNGINVGGSCHADYDHTAYPGPEREGAACPPGVLQCGPDGKSVCKGGEGPTPEICDGVDNDCDGQTDESGSEPDGIDGSADPNDKNRHIGDACGNSNGQCTPGKLGCVNGRVVCVGSTGGSPEVCDCIDNDCDGLIDEDATGTDSPLCSTGKTCVQKTDSSQCQCAGPCGGGEFPCPTGQSCEQVLRSGTTDPAPGNYCIPKDTCGDCASKTVKRADGKVECAPAGTQPGSSRPIPVCQCKGASGCHEPCFNSAVTCPDGQGCAPSTGTCQPTGNCFYFGCAPGEACTANRTCVSNPCADNPCKADEVCRPSADFSSADCVGSCAGVTCDAGQECVDGKCEATGCSSGCAAGEYCRPAAGDAGTGACGPSLCAATTCQGGEYCNPRTGGCGADPCSGVVCPADQVCDAGQCLTPKAPPVKTDGGVLPTDGGSNVGGASGVGGKGNGTGAKGPEAPTTSAFGLATGGGGCACSLSDGASSTNRSGLLVGLAAAALTLGRRRKRRTSATEPSATRGGVR